MLSFSTIFLRMRFCAAATHLAKCLLPPNLMLQHTNTIPKIELKSENYLMKNWWSQKPFLGKLRVPMFSFEKAEFKGISVTLPEDIFNQPLRRDLIYRLYDYRVKLDTFRTKVTRNRSETSGSGRKIRQQKKTGMARLSDKRAPHLRKGGKAHGSKPKVYSYPLNMKIKLAALKALLTAKLTEGKIKIVDSQKIEEGKTKILWKALREHVADQRAIFCIITSQEADPNFILAHQNIRQCISHNSYNLDVMSLFKADRIFITKEGLEELIENIYKTTYIAYRQPHMKPIQEKSVRKEEEEQEEEWDPQQPYQFKFKILADYLELYEKVKAQTPHLLDREKLKIRKIE